ncbi:chorismate lyase [Pseudoalteromonas sp. MMG012]|uniref:chorismate--pyruvate lyase family protein n=1 Tax=Pseudoalteromonas sp. MMG012 TaxID=2822686 RepID=UPI001B3A5698|nr:chorismate lyase [Pseudoalteromonas sp. MMG012]MBQ4851640.1 chorismate lyase [Pseudoalteromonas sp. MMG012]
MFEYPFSIDYFWQSAAELQCVPPSIANLLFDQGSLTSLLKQQCQQFRVKVLSEKWVPATKSHIAIFNGDVQTVLCREVLLYCDDMPKVYAQSWITQAAYQVGVSGLGETPLGEVLFCDDSWLRSQLDVCTFQSGSTFSTLSRVHNEAAEQLYARRRVFTKSDAQVMVCEIFLPGE